MKKIIVSGAIGYLLGVSTPIVLTVITLKKYPHLGNILQDTMLSLMGFNPYITRKARRDEVLKYSRPSYNSHFRYDYNNAGVNHYCDTCKFKNTWYENEPCNSCYNHHYCKWEPNKIAKEG